MQRWILALALAEAASMSRGQEAEPPPNPDPVAAMEAMEPMDHWMTMYHGYAFLTGDFQGGPSGGNQLESQNHFMISAMHALWGGKLSLSGTFSLEPATIPPAGSPELFQRGETYNGVLLVDLQHPHDFFVELAAAWERRVASDLKLRLYLAPVGEPALGPAPYVHRLSASENPIAPLSHHNQDATHITYDVMTLGTSSSIATLEGSVFHGAEPDENRWNIQAGALDSYSGRLTLRPAPGLSMQISAGHLEHPEAIEEGNQTRATASVTYEKATPGGFLAVMAATGRNRLSDGEVEWGTLLEWTWKFADVNFLWGRVEAVDRDVYELTHKRQRPADVLPDRTRVHSGSIGYSRDVPLYPRVETGFGAGVSFYGFTSRLDGVYGTMPVSWLLFGRIRFGGHPGGMAHEGH
ncbi:MAG: hypothetical protein WAU32_03525 [Thermoanaerobaculia bacterium]